MREITNLLGIPEVSTTVGSSVPSTFFTSIASEMGVTIVNGMPAMARKIVESSHLPWHEDFSSENSPSGGGGTVTAVGLLQVKNAVLVWQGKPPLQLPSNVIFEEWEPSIYWEAMRASLPKELMDITQRPGATQFREHVLSEYNYKCAISGCSSIEVIDVAHIVPYFGLESDEIQNAIPLRADLHRLFDRGLLSIEYEPSEKLYISKVHDFVANDYADFHNSKVNVPEAPLSKPSKPALKIHKDLFKEKWTVI